MNDTPVRVVIVEDEPQIRRFVCDALQSEGYLVLGTGTAHEGQEAVMQEKPQLVILDLGLPDMSGLALIRELRAWSHLPILILSARTSEEDKIAALDAGADDYLTKPFGIGELLARVRVLLRRITQDGGTAPLHCFGSIEVDLARRVVMRGGADIHLTHLEYRLLCVLLANTGKVMTNQALMREVWGPGHVDQEHYVRIYMRRLRQKLEIEPSRPQYLLTETGIGYRFQPDNPP